MKQNNCDIELKRITISGLCVVHVCHWQTPPSLALATHTHTHPALSRYPPDWTAGCLQWKRLVVTKVKVQLNPSIEWDRHSTMQPYKEPSRGWWKPMENWFNPNSNSFMFRIEYKPGSFTRIRHVMQLLLQRVVVSRRAYNLDQVSNSSALWPLCIGK